MPGDDRFELAQVHPLGGSEPDLFGLRDRDPGELARSRVAELAALERGRDRRQRGNCTDHAQPFKRDARRVTHLALHVVDEARTAIAAPELELLCLPDRCSLLHIERAARTEDPRQGAMHAFASPRVVVH